MNLPTLCSSARVPLVHLSAAHVHSEQAQSQILISIQVKGQINKHPAMNIMWQFNSLCLNQNTNSPALFFYIWGNRIRPLGTCLVLFKFIQDLFCNYFTWSFIFFNLFNIFHSMLPLWVSCHISGSILLLALQQTSVDVVFLLVISHVLFVRLTYLKHNHTQYQQQLWVSVYEPAKLHGGGWLSLLTMQKLCLPPPSPPTYEVSRCVLFSWLRCHHRGAIVNARIQSVDTVNGAF